MWKILLLIEIRNDIILISLIEIIFSLAGILKSFSLFLIISKYKIFDVEISHWSDNADMPVLRYGAHRHFKDFIYAFRNRFRSFDTIFQISSLLCFFLLF